MRRKVPARFRTSISPVYLYHVPPPPPCFSAMDPPRTRSRSRSGFFHFGMNSVGSSGGGNAAGNGGMMNASGGGGSYQQQSNPGWAPHHGGRSHPESQQHTQGSYLSAGAQRHSSHGAHRHPGAGKLASVNRARSPARCIITHSLTGYTP